MKAEIKITVVTGEHQHFTERLESYLNDPDFNWKLIGGTSIAVGKHTAIFCQLLTREVLVRDK